jgi:hypothetical protein
VKILIASTPAMGDLNPLLAIMRELVAEYHEITFLTGSAFRARVESSGSKFVSPPTDADFDLREILSVSPELKDIPPEHERFRVAIERIRGSSDRPRLDSHADAAPCHVSKTERDHGSQQSIPARPVGHEKSRSALVRRLVSARHDPAKRRIRHLLSDISDDRLLSFGLTAQDIVLLRGTPNAPG